MNLLLRIREVRFKDQFDRVCCVTCRPLSLIDTFRRDKKIRNSVSISRPISVASVPCGNLGLFL